MEPITLIVPDSEMPEDMTQVGAYLSARTGIPEALITWRANLSEEWAGEPTWHVTIETP